MKQIFLLTLPGGIPHNLAFIYIVQNGIIDEMFISGGSDPAKVKRIPALSKPELNNKKWNEFEKNVNEHYKIKKITEKELFLLLL